MATVPNVTLNNGLEMPILGFGVFQIPDPEEVAAAAAYLLGPEAAFVTGSDLLIDGGVVAAMRMGRLG